MLVEISDERELLLETGGAVLHARRYLEGCGRFLIHNVDILSNCDIRWFEQQVKDDALASLLVSDRKTTRFLLFVPDTMRLVGWMNTDSGDYSVVSPDIVPQECRALAFSGIHILSDQVLGLMEEYVKEKGCPEILNDLLWEGFDPAEIPFDTLPEKFVIKVTHGSSFNIICTDKSKLNREETIAKCRKWLQAKFLEAYGEWFYGVERPRVIVEKYLDDGTGRLRDYKIYCFGGVPRYIGVDSGDGSHHYKDIYDAQWNLLPGYEMAYTNSGIALEKPAQLEELLRYAAILSEDFHHARVDFYLVEGKVVFGEITFTNSAGFGRVAPEKIALEMGEYLKLK
jgi:hypothetical protein